MSYLQQTKIERSGHGRDRMVVGFATAYAISAYHGMSVVFSGGYSGFLHQ